MPFDIARLKACCPCVGLGLHPQGSRSLSACARTAGYSRNLLLAELEYTLETDGRLQAFEDRFTEVTGRLWGERRYTILAKNEASHALHLLEPDTFPQTDSWAKTAVEPTVDADWFAGRALTLLERRSVGARRLAFVVDEAGQYVARDVQRMLALQGLAEAFQKKMGRIWLAVTERRDR